MQNDWKRVASILIVFLLLSVVAQGYVLWRLKLMEEAKEKAELELQELREHCKIYED